MSLTVSATMGVMRPLIGKLAELAGGEYSKLKAVKKQAAFLEKELSAMKAALEKMELMDELDPVARDWRDHVREMSYDMENCIDDFVCQFGGGNAKLGFIKKTARNLKMLGQCHRIADRMEELKALAIEANDRRVRYKFDDRNPDSSFVAIDPRMTAIYVEATSLVGIDGPSEDLVDLLTDTKEKLKVVSIVGFRGLGKTTLAKKVYDEIKGEFQCTLFVSVSQRPNMTGLFHRMQLKLGMDRSSQVYEVEDIIEDLRKYLTPSPDLPSKRMRETEKLAANMFEIVCEMRPSTSPSMKLILCVANMEKAMKMSRSGLKTELLVQNSRCTSRLQTTL